MDKYDIVVIGGGIVGAATAWQLKDRHPSLSIAIIEKEAKPAQHMSGHNSGVIHAGVYYTPGSMRARFCRAGCKATKAFSKRYQIPYEVCGKLIVATDEIELGRMEDLIDRAARNGVDFDVVDKAGLREMEPNVNGAGAIWSPTTGIVDYGRMTVRMIELFMEAGGEVHYSEPVQMLREGESVVVIETARRNLEAAHVISCGGLTSDRIVKMLGLKLDFRIIPFRGEYYDLPESRNGLVKHLIYPVPDPALPFLGVHVTKTIKGNIHIGPNAVLAFKREGYSKFSFNAGDAIESLTYPGLWKLLAKYAGPTIEEMKGYFSKERYLEQVRKYCPSLTIDDMTGYYAGVRAQALGPDGNLIDDFKIVETGRTLNVCNAPSPAATSSIAIGEHIVKQAEEKFGLGDPQEGNSAPIVASYAG